MPSGDWARSVVEGTGAEILVESLCRAGVEVIFGLSGDTGVALYDALYHRRDEVRHVMTRDERNAAYMADAYARCTNRVGVVEVSSGGGTTYAVGGLGEAFASSVPVLIITSDIHRGSRGTGALTEIDQGLLFVAVTKWRATVPSADRIPSLVAEALVSATGGRPAPVCLIVPEDVLDERARATFPPASTAFPHERPVAEEGAIRLAAEALGRAERPAIVAGSGVHLSGAWSELAGLAEMAGIPVATTIHGKGTLAEVNPLSLGVVGANGARDYANEYLAGADVVLFVGTRANATDTNSYTSPPREGTVVIQIDIDADRAGRNFPGSIALVGDAKVALRQLISALPEGEGAERRRRLLAWIEGRRRTWFGANSESRIPGSEGLLDPRDVVRAIRREAGVGTLLTADPGTHPRRTSRPIGRPRRRSARSSSPGVTARWATPSRPPSAPPSRPRIAAS